MKELHTLIDKWEQRFIDTAQETMNEKINKLSQQVLSRNLAKIFKLY